MADASAAATVPASAGAFPIRSTLTLPPFAVAVAFDVIIPEFMTLSLSMPPCMPADFEVVQVTTESSTVAILK